MISNKRIFVSEYVSIDRGLDDYFDEEYPAFTCPVCSKSYRYNPYIEGDYDPVWDGLRYVCRDCLSYDDYCEDHKLYSKYVITAPKAIKQRLRFSRWFCGRLSRQYNNKLTREETYCLCSNCQRLGENGSGRAFCTSNVANFPCDYKCYKCDRVYEQEYETRKPDGRCSKFVKEVRICQ